MLTGRLIEQVRCSGFDSPEEVVHLFVGGSELHGAKVGATDDLDIYGVFIEPPAKALGFTGRDHFVWSTASDERRNGPEDVDLTMYSLRRWAELAMKGNATALHFLFAEATAESQPIWSRLQERRELFLSRSSARQFIGFANNQKQRITGEKGHGAKGQRPEYVGKYGFDTKAAMHCLRLYAECVELMQAGRITLPRPEKEILIEVRSGRWTLATFLETAEQLEDEAEHAASTSHLPDRVDADAISQLISGVYLRHWNTTVAS